MIKTEVRHEMGQNKACSIQCSIKSVKTDGSREINLCQFICELIDNVKHSYNNKQH